MILSELGESNAQQIVNIKCSMFGTRTDEMFLKVLRRLCVCVSSSNSVWKFGRISEGIAEKIKNENSETITIQKAY